jgi:hypothetical protein
MSYKVKIRSRVEALSLVSLVIVSIGRARDSSNVLVIYIR